MACVNVGSLLTFIKKHYEADFAALDAALVDGAGLIAAVTTLTGHISQLLQGDAQLLIPVVLSHAVISRPGDPTPFSAKAAECVTHTWRAYMRSHPSEVRALLRHTEADTVPQHLKAPGPTWTGPQACRLDPAQFAQYQKAYSTVLTLLKAALAAASATHHTPQALRCAWAASFPAKSDDVSYILAQQAPPYEALISRTGCDVDKEERKRRLRACFSPALLHEHNDLMARAGQDASCVPWADCVDYAVQAAAYLKLRKTHEAPPPPPPPVPPQRNPNAQIRAATQRGPHSIVRPAADAAWVRANRSPLISYGICSKIVFCGECDRPPDACPFQHELPERIDTASAEWQAALRKSEDYHARKNGHREAVAAPARATPAAPPAAPPPHEPPRAQTFAAQLQRFMADSLDSEGPDEEPDQPPLCMPPPPGALPANATSCPALAPPMYDENDEELPPPLRSVSFSALASPALPHGKTYSHLTGEVVDEDWDDGSYDWVEDPDNIYDRRR